MQNVQILVNNLDKNFPFFSLQPTKLNLPS
jgi:hypothetical protein